MDNFELLVSQLNQARLLIDENLKHINEESNLTNLEILADKLDSNFCDATENLKKQAQEKQQVRDTFKGQRKEKEIVANTNSNKAFELKKEIEAKALENQLTETQLRDQSPPLILKLMGSSSSNTTIISAAPNLTNLVTLTTSSPVSAAYEDGYSQQATTISNFIPQNPNYQGYNNNLQPNLQPSFNQIQHHDTSTRNSQSNSFNNNYYRPQAHYERNNPMLNVRHSNYLEEQQQPGGGSFRQPSTNNNQVVPVQQPVRPSSMYDQQSIAYQRASDPQQANIQQNNGSWSIVTLPYPQPASQAQNYFSIYQNDKNYPQQQQSTYDNRYRAQSGSDDQRRPSTLWFNNAEPSSFQSARAPFSDSSSNQRLTNHPIQQSSHLDLSQQQQQQQRNSMMYNMPAPYLSSQQKSESQLVQRGTRNAPNQSPFMQSTSSSSSNNVNDNSGNDYVTI